MNLEDGLRIAEIVNTAGGREKPIIEAHTCEECRIVFFSQRQDTLLRETLGSKTLCPGCRKDEDKKQKRERAAYNSKFAIILSETNIISDGLHSLEWIYDAIARNIDLSEQDKRNVTGKNWPVWKRAVRGLLPDGSRDVKFIKGRRVQFLGEEQFTFGNSAEK